jgi:hypothetical protein
MSKEFSLLEDKLKVLDFKLELILQFTKCNINLNLDSCKTMEELAFITGLNKDEFTRINELLLTQIHFYKSSKNSSYMSPRQVTRIEEDADVFQALSKEEYENNILTIAPGLKKQSNVLVKIAQINGIWEMYYDQLAIDIRRAKNERLDKEAKLLNSYKDNKAIIEQLFSEMELLNQEYKNNIKQADKIISFFKDNELVKISIFYNGELWEISEDDKKVVINDNSYINNICKYEYSEVLDKTAEILKDKKCEYHDLFVHILKSSPTSSKKIEDLQAFYKEMDNYNKNEYIIKEEIIAFRDRIITHKTIVNEILTSYNEYVSSLKL